MAEKKFKSVLARVFHVGKDKDKEKSTTTTTSNSNEHSSTTSPTTSPKEQKNNVVNLPVHDESSSFLKSMKKHQSLKESEPKPVTVDELDLHLSMELKAELDRYLPRQKPKNSASPTQTPVGTLRTPNKTMSNTQESGTLRRVAPPVSQSSRDIRGKNNALRSSPGDPLTEESKEFFVDYIQRAQEKHYKIAILCYKNLYVVPSDFATLKNLRKVDLSFNNLERLPESLCRLPSLDNLNLAGNKISYVPTLLGNCRGLKKLSLSHNVISRLPSEIGNLKALRRFHIEYNFLNELPKEVLGMSALYELHLDYNLLTEIPSEIYQLTKLRQLSITGNCISRLPSTIVKLPRLTDLFMRDNLITWISPRFAKLKRIRSLNIDGNPLPLVLLEAHTLRDRKYLLEEVLWRESWIAFFMGSHQRLGINSPVKKLPKDVLIRILSYVREEGTKQEIQEQKEIDAKLEAEKKKREAELAELMKNNATARVISVFHSSTPSFTPYEDEI